MRSRRAVTTASAALVVLLCLAAGFASFGCRKTALRKKRLIRSCEGKILPTIAACELQVSGHKRVSVCYILLANCTAHLVKREKDLALKLINLGRSMDFCPCFGS